MIILARVTLMQPGLNLNNLKYVFDAVDNNFTCVQTITKNPL